MVLVCPFVVLLLAQGQLWDSRLLPNETGSHGRDDVCGDHFLSVRFLSKVAHLCDGVCGGGGG